MRNFSPAKKRVDVFPGESVRVLLASVLAYDRGLAWLY